MTHPWKQSSSGIAVIKLTPEALAAETRAVFSVETMRELGVVPLGYEFERKMFLKRRLLRVGMLRPESTVELDRVEKAARAKLGGAGFHALKVVRVTQDDFERTVSECFPVADRSTRSGRRAA